MKDADVRFVSFRLLASIEKCFRLSFFLRICAVMISILLVRKLGCVQKSNKVSYHFFVDKNDFNVISEDDKNWMIQLNI